MHNSYVQPISKQYLSKRNQSVNIEKRLAIVSCIVSVILLFCGQMARELDSIRILLDAKAREMEMLQDKLS